MSGPGLEIKTSERSTQPQLRLGQASGTAQNKTQSPKEKALLALYLFSDMTSPKKPPESERPATAILVQPSSPRFPITPTGAHRKIGIAVDLSDESAFAVKWAVQNYLRPGDVVILLHVRPTSVLYGADWGSIDLSMETDEDKYLAFSVKQCKKTEAAS
ncbi:unnamed protein product, partial [Vitis vinifera]